MASKTGQVYYWDSSVFIAYMNNEVNRGYVVEGMWNTIMESDKGIIVTSAVSIIEVSHARYEKANSQLDPDIDQYLDGLWKHPRVLIVEAPSKIMYIARDLMRKVIPEGHSLGGNDAVHLATAMFVEKNGRLIQEINTYDPKWAKFQNLVNIKICEPHYEPKPKTQRMFEGEE